MKLSTKQQSTRECMYNIKQNECVAQAVTKTTLKLAPLGTLQQLKMIHSLSHAGVQSLKRR